MTPLPGVSTKHKCHGYLLTIVTTTLATLYFVNMLNLESSHPEMYGEFLNGNFAVQQSITNTLGKLEPDKVIETTINKDTKSPGGTTGMITYS